MPQCQFCPPALKEMTSSFFLSADVLDSPRLKTGRQRERVRDEQEGGEAAPDGEKRPMAPKVRKQSG